MSLANGLQSWWTFNNITDGLQDMVGNYDFTVIGTPTEITGKVGNGLEINSGSNRPLMEYATHGGALFAAGGSFSISGWIKQYAGKYALIMYKQTHTPSDDRDIHIYIEPSRTFRFISKGQTDIISAAAWPSTDVWHHFVCTFSEANHRKRWYLNGSLYKEQGVGAAQIQDNGYDFAIGAMNNGQYAGQLMGADQIAIWNRELDQSDIDSLYNNGDGVTYNTGVLGYGQQSVLRAEYMKIQIRN